MKALIVLICVSFACVSARPWNMSTIDVDMDLMSQSQSPLMTTIDSVNTRVSRALRTASPSLAPLLSIASLAYVGYVGAVMYMPSVLKEAGIPLLEDFNLKSKMARTEESGFIDSMATGYMKDVISRTEVADIVRNTSMSAVNNGMGTLKRTRKFLDIGLGAFQGAVGRVSTMLSPECLLKYMCKVGQFTSLHVPALGPLLRSINTFDIDDYSQALIDGTTIGDCGAVYFTCPL